MCTVTWWREPAGGDFLVWFNRDERRTRPVSEPVRARVADDGTHFLAPCDPASGGTWLLANEHGLVVGVLNHYGAGVEVIRSATSVHSRGQLPLRFAACRGVADVERLAQAIAPEQFAPFILVAWDPSRCATWASNGTRLVAESAPRPPLTTSSYRSPEVCAWRRERFAAVAAAGGPDSLATYHGDVAHADPAFNVRMRRPDARTESICRVRVTAGEIRFEHRREAPDALAAVDVTEAVLPHH